MPIDPGMNPVGRIYQDLQAPFHDVLFPPTISWGAKGGPSYKTVVSDRPGGGMGWERRDSNWLAQRGQYDVSHTLKDPIATQELLTFFYCRRGRAHAFRYKDWGDYQAVNDPVVALPDGTYQLSKYYFDPVSPYTRAIMLPSAPSLYDGGSALLTPATSGENTITDVSIYPGYAPYAGTGYSIGDTVAIYDLAPSGGVSVNAVLQITGTGAGGSVTTISLLAGGAGLYFFPAAYGTVNISSSGTGFVCLVNAVSPIYAGDYLLDPLTGLVTVTGGTPATWSGEFDIMARFDTDISQFDVKAFDDANWEGIRIVEIMGKELASAPAGLNVVSATRHTVRPDTFGSLGDTGSFCFIPPTTKGNCLIVAMASTSGPFGPTTYYPPKDGRPADLPYTGSTVDTFIHVSGAFAGDNSVTNGGSTDIWYAFNIEAGITFVVPGPSASDITLMIWVWEVAGLTSVDDAAATDDEAASTTLVGPSVTGTGSPSFIVATQYCEDILQLVTLQWTWDGTFNFRWDYAEGKPDPVGRTSLAAAHIVTTGAQNPTFYCQQAGAGCVSVAAFK